MKVASQGLSSPRGRFFFCQELGIVLVELSRKRNRHNWITLGSVNHRVKFNLEPSMWSVVKTATLKKVSPKRQLPFWYEKKDSSCLFGYENSTFWSKRRLSFLSFLHGSNKNRCRRVWHLFSIALIRTWYEFFSYGSDKNRLVRVLFLWLW